MFLIGSCVVRQGQGCRDNGVDNLDQEPDGGTDRHSAVRAEGT